MKRKTHKEFVKEIKYIHPDLIVLGEYVNNRAKILIQDKLGIQYLIKPLTLIQGKRPTIQSAVNKTDAFRAKLKKISPKLTVLSEYSTSYRKMLIKDELGIRYKMLPGDLLNKKVRPSINSAVDKNTAFKLIVQKIHGTKYDYSLTKYIGNREKVEIFCKKCQQQFYITPNRHLQGHGCISCGLQRAKDKNQKIVEERAKTIEADIISIHNDRINCDKLIYKGNKIKSLFGCNVNEEHGYWSATTNDILSGCGCPKCNSSKGEVKISDTLKSLGIKFVQQKTFKECRFKNPLKFDFYIPKYNMCIEYDGRQHFEPIDLFEGEEGFVKTQKRDVIKNKFCQENGIRLLRIPCTEKDNIEQILIENL